MYFVFVSMFRLYQILNLFKTKFYIGHGRIETLMMSETTMFHCLISLLNNTFC